MMWKSTSSNGWEYLIILKGLGFESYVYYFNKCIILVLCLNVLSDNVIPKL